MAGMTSSVSSVLLTIPPTIGAAIRFMTLAPAPPPQRMGSSPAVIAVTVEQNLAGTPATRWAGINPNGPWFECSTTSTLLRPSWDGCGCPEGHIYVRGWAVVRVIDWSSFYGPYAGVWQRSILLRRS